MADGSASPPKAPRWVKISILVALVLVVGFLLFHLTGNGLGSHAE